MQLVAMVSTSLIEILEMTKLARGALYGERKSRKSSIASFTLAAPLSDTTPLVQTSFHSVLAAWAYANLDQNRAEQEMFSLFQGQWLNGLVPHTIYGYVANRSNTDPYLQTFPQLDKLQTENSYIPGPSLWQNRSFGVTSRTSNELKGNAANGNNYMEHNNNGPPASIYTSSLASLPLHASVILKMRLGAGVSDAFLRYIMPKLIDWHEYLYTQRTVNALYFDKSTGQYGSWLPKNSPIKDPKIFRTDGRYDNLIVSLHPWEALVTYDQPDLDLVLLETNDGYNETLYNVALDLATCVNIHPNTSATSRSCPYGIIDIAYNSILLQATRDLYSLCENILYNTGIGEQGIVTQKDCDKIQGWVESHYKDFKQFVTDRYKAEQQRRASGGTIRLAITGLNLWGNASVAVPLEFLGDLYGIVVHESTGQGPNSNKDAAQESSLLDDSEAQATISQLLNPAAFLSLHPLRVGTHNSAFTTGKSTTITGRKSCAAWPVYNVPLVLSLQASSTQNYVFLSQYLNETTRSEVCYYPTSITTTRSNLHNKHEDESPATRRKNRGYTSYGLRSLQRRKVVNDNPVNKKMERLITSPNHDTDSIIIQDDSSQCVCSFADAHDPDTKQLGLYSNQINSSLTAAALLIILNPAAPLPINPLPLTLLYILGIIEMIVVCLITSACLALSGVNLRVVQLQYKKEKLLMDEGKYRSKKMREKARRYKEMLRRRREAARRRAEAKRREEEEARRHASSNASTTSNADNDNSGGYLWSILSYVPGVRTLYDTARQVGRLEREIDYLDGSEEGEDETGRHLQNADLNISGDTDEGTTYHSDTENTYNTDSYTRRGRSSRTKYQSVIEGNFDREHSQSLLGNNVQRTDDMMSETSDTFFQDVEYDDSTGGQTITTKEKYSSYQSDNNSTSYYHEHNNNKQDVQHNDGEMSSHYGNLTSLIDISEIDSVLDGDETGGRWDASSNTHPQKQDDNRQRTDNVGRQSRSGPLSRVSASSSVGSPPDSSSRYGSM
eukprot:g3488.t1